MRLVKEVVERDGSGSVTLYPEDPEDMWAAYNVIRNNDLLRASAVRRVSLETSTGSTASQRLHFTLTIRVRGMDFDAQAATLHVSGQITEETPYTRVGQYHTLDLELNRNFTLEKTEGWDSVSVKLVRDACDQRKGASAWAVVMQEGIANIAVLMGERTVLRQRVSVPVPGKKGGERGHDKGLQKFFETTLDTLLRQMDMDVSIPILLASPGFTADSFHKYILDTATRANNKALLAQKSNFLIVHSHSGQMHALSEVLASPEVQNRLADTKYARETRLLDDFMKLLRLDDGRAWYGPREVETAVDGGAVGRGGGILLLSNSLFRSQDIGARRRWVKLHDRVKEVEGGEVRVLSSEHESGKRLDALGGIAAILTFPMHDLDEDNEEEEEQAVQEEPALNGHNGVAVGVNGIR